MNKSFKVLLASFALSFVFFGALNSVQNGMQKYFYAWITEPFYDMAFVDASELNRDYGLELDAQSAASLEINEHGKQRFVFKKDIQKALPIASLTKLMTALLVVENYDLSRKVAVSEKAASQYDIPVYGNLEKGEALKIEDLLELMLHYSSNDAAYALAEVMGADEFVARMNERAGELAMVNTWFMNPHGLDPDDSVPNYSTAGDLAKLSRYILENHPLVFEISLKNGPYAVDNGVLSVNAFGNYVVGGKTGYTEKAGGCMLFLFSKDDKYNISIVLGSESPDARVSEMQKLVSWLVKS